jgi:protein-disulfide isomerase
VSAAGVDEERRRRLIKLASAVGFLAIVAVAVLIVVSQSGSDGGDASSIEGAAEVRAELQGIPQRGLVLGDPAAEVRLVEFGDLQCPVCKGYAEEIVPEVIDSRVRNGEAQIEFRNFTIISEESIDAAAAAIAAGEQGRGWDFLELLYRNQGIEASGYVTDEFLTAVAEGAGVTDIERWDASRRSARTLAQVESETAEAGDLGLTGTPSFVVEGPGVDGGEQVLGTPGDAGTLESAIEAAG